VVDNESTISSQTGCTSSTVSSDTSGVTFTCVASSAGGTSNQSVTIKRDATAPTLTLVVSPNPIILGGSATVTAGAVDTLSDLASQSCDTLDTSSVGSKSVACTATDNAGNSASASASYTVLPAFPPSNVLDNFNRANGGLGSNWAGLTDKAFYSIASNRLDVQAGGPIVWKSAFGVSQEAFVTLSTIDPKSPSTGLLLKVQDSSRAEAGAILVVYDAKAKVVRVSAIRVGAREWTAYPNQAATFANGDVLGARAKADGTVAIYQNGTLIATITLNSADKAFFNAKGGKIGLWALGAPKVFFDDFGGGTVTP
jgi:hypothetical protein